VASFLGSFYIIAYIPYIRFTEPYNFQYFQLLSTFLSLSSFIVSPILTLFVFYRIGKKFELKSNLKSSIIRLMTGAYLGQFVGSTTVYLIGIFLIEEFTVYWPQYLSRIFSVSFLGLFFPSFTALAIAYLRNNESEIK
jgi:hypothetical protein